MITYLSAAWRKLLRSRAPEGKRRLMFEALEDRSLLALVADLAPVATPRNTAVGDVTITFSDAGNVVPVTGLDLGDFLLTLDGNQVPLTNLSLSGSGAVYTLNLAAATATAGTYLLRLVASTSGITEVGTGAALTDDATDTWVLDTTVPTATFSPITPNPRSSPVASVIVTFSEPVTGVDVPYFGLTRNGSTVTLTGVTVSGSGATWTVNLGAVTAPTGNYELTIAPTIHIVDAAGNSLATGNSVTWTTDATAPTATITVASPRNTPVSAASIAFSKPVTGVDINDFRLTKNGTSVALTGLSVSGAGTNYAIDLSTVTSTSGTYVLTLAASGSGIADSLGNALAANATATWLMDTTAVTATIAAVTPNPRMTPVGTVTITFNKPVTGVDILDFTLTRGGAAVSLTGLTVGGSGATYTVDLTSVTQAYGAYTFTLLAANSGITDAAGNALAANASITFTIDDRYEDNDILSKAADLGIVTGPLTLPSLGLVDGSDWFRFTTNKTGVAGNGVTIAFQNSQGDLDLDLLNVAGVRLAGSAGTGNSEFVSLAGRSAGTYYVHVYSKTGASNPSYALAINSPVVLGDDAYEDNDTFGAAPDLGSITSLVTIPQLVMADGSDWYKFHLLSTGTASDFAAIDFLNSQGNLDLQLYNSSNTLLTSSTGTTDGQQISLQGRPAGAYYVHVVGVSGATNPNYTLEIHGPPQVSSPDNTFNIQFLFSGLTTSQVAIFQQAAAKWESIIVGDLPSAVYTRAGFTSPVLVDDLLIDASAAPIDGVGNILGQSTNDSFRAGSGLPYHGTMQFDTADLAAMEANGSLLSVVEHEMAHVLGFGSLWTTKGLLVNSGTANVAYTGAQAVAAYDSVFNTTATSIPVENTGGAGTANSHWRETVFGNELMTGFYNSGIANPLSRITIASLADLGYTVNYAAADPYAPPSGATGGGGTLIVANTPTNNDLSVLKLAPPAGSSASSGSTRGGDVSLGPAPTMADAQSQAAATALYGSSNPANPLDVSDDGTVSPADALMVINALNNPRLAPSGAAGGAEGQSAAPYYDVNGDGHITPLDALLVINYLNAKSSLAAGEGEAAAWSGAMPLDPTDTDYLLNLLGADVAAAPRRG